MIEPLPEGLGPHNTTCDRSRGGGSSRLNGTPGRCGKPAVVIDRQTCGCGSCDMSCHLCEHHARYAGTQVEAEEQEREHCDDREARVRAESPVNENMLKQIAEWRRTGVPFGPKFWQTNIVQMPRTS